MLSELSCGRMFQPFRVIPTPFGEAITGETVQGTVLPFLTRKDNRS
jgi:hypothetical protein